LIAAKLETVAAVYGSIAGFASKAAEIVVKGG
jgi:hypothetical protein